MIAKTKQIQIDKSLLVELPILDAPVPDYLYVTTQNGRCAKVELQVKVGDKVNYGQRIGTRFGGFFEQPMFSPCSGEIVAIEKHLHRSGKLVDFVKIKNDHEDRLDSSIVTRSDEEIKALTQEDVVKIVKDCALVGLGGSSFPTYVKLGTKEKINTILLNGIECEPLLQSDHRLMMENAEDIMEGILILEHIFHLKDVRICIKKKYAEIQKHLEEVIASKFPDSGVTVAPLGNYYPQGWELEMIRNATGIALNPGELPMKHGILNFNVATVVGIRDAVKYNMPVMNRYVTIQGDGIAHPAQLRARVGSLATDLIRLCGGYKNPEIAKFIFAGGPMMGLSLPSDDLVCTRCVTGIFVLNERAVEENPCIRCGSCVLSCPAHLEPVLIMDAYKSMDREMIKALNPLRCVECGLCTYSCTSGIRVLDWVRRAKIVAKLP